MSRLAIVGAGVAGCAAAWSLRAAPLDVVVFEKSRGISGRAATRRRHGCAYDHGANYFKAEEPCVETLIHRMLPTDELVSIRGEVWTFDERGTLHEGDLEHNRAAKWTYRNGINTLGKLLLGGTRADVHRQRRVVRLHQSAAGWHLTGEGGDALGTFEAVLLTPPAPQTLTLVQDGEMEAAVRSAIEQALGGVSYRTQFSFALAYDSPIERPAPFFGLVNTGGGHAVAWLSFEDDKPGHVPAGTSLLIVQMAPAWSRARYEAPPEALALEAAEHASALLDTDLRQPTWTDHQRWRYALPEARADGEALTPAHAAGLFVAGDALEGQGRVALALRSGLDAAERLRRYLLPSQT